MILQAWDTLPSCFASSSRPTLARITLRSFVMVGSSVLGYRRRHPPFRSRVTRTKQTRLSDQVLANTLQVGIKPPDQPEDMLLRATLLFSERLQLMHQTLSVDPAQRVLADVELPGVVAD